MSLTGLTVLLVAIGVLMVAAIVGLVMLFVLDRDDEPPPPARKSPTAVRSVKRTTGSPPASAGKKPVTTSAGSKQISPTSSAVASGVQKSATSAAAKKVAPTVPKKQGNPTKPVTAKHSVGNKVRIVNRPDYEGRIGKVIGVGPLYLKLRMDDDGDVLIVGQVNAVPISDTQPVASGVSPMKPVVEVRPKSAATGPPAKDSPPDAVVATKAVAKPPSRKAPPAATKKAPVPKRKVAQKEASPAAQKGPVRGWYTDPGNDGGQRYWDGAAWTEYRAVPVTTGIPPTTSLDPAPVERGSNRWLIGVAMLIASAVVVIAAFTEWSHMTYSASDQHSGQLTVSVALSGFGSVSVSVPGIRDTEQRQSVEQREADALEAEGPNAPGIAVLTIGLVMAGAALAYLRTRRRMAAAGVIAALSGLGLMNGVWRIANPREMFNDPAGWSAAHYSAGFGLIVFTFAAVVLVGLGATALVLERRGR